jgi:hypothetical protein
MRRDAGMRTAVIVVLVVLSAALSGQQRSSSPPAFPREQARKVLENDTIAIWDVTWPKGKPTGPLERRYDQVVVTLVPTTRGPSITAVSGPWHTSRRAP